PSAPEALRTLRRTAATLSPTLALLRAALALRLISRRLRLCVAPGVLPLRLVGCACLLPRTLVLRNSILALLLVLLRIVLPVLLRIIRVILPLLLIVIGLVGVIRAVVDRTRTPVQPVGSRGTSHETSRCGCRGRAGIIIAGICCRIICNGRCRLLHDHSRRLVLRHVDYLGLRRDDLDDLLLRHYHLFVVGFQISSSFRLAAENLDRLEH